MHSFIFILCFSFAFAFAACSQKSGLTGGSGKRAANQPSNSVIGRGQMDSSAVIGDGQGVSDETFGNAISRCKTTNLNRKSFSTSFPATEGKCNWDRGKASSAMMGHLEQKLKLDISENWVICTLEVSSTKNDFYYDDKIVMTINDRLLWGNSGIFSLLTSNRDSIGLVKYDWEKIFGKTSNDKISCIEGSTTCTGPGTQQNGAIGIALNEQTNQKVMRLLLEERRLDFQLIITGDDDPSIDCGHNGMPLNVEVSYYEK